MTRRVSTIFSTALLALAAAALPQSTLAAGGGGGGGGGGSSAGVGDADFDAGVAAVQREDWAEVTVRMGKVVQRDRRNADAFNYLGLAARHLGRMDESLRHYETALKLDPRHLGAHEYLGEAYLQMGRLADAQAQLKALDRLCLFTCEEQKELREKIEAFQRTAAK